MRVLFVLCGVRRTEQHRVILPTEYSAPEYMEIISGRGHPLSNEVEVDIHSD